jgi:hypothetical protein
VGGLLSLLCLLSLHISQDKQMQQGCSCILPAMYLHAAAVSVLGLLCDLQGALYPCNCLSVGVRVGLSLSIVSLLCWWKSLCCHCTLPLINNRDDCNKGCCCILPARW